MQLMHKPLPPADEVTQHSLLSEFCSWQQKQSSRTYGNGTQGMGVQNRLQLQYAAMDAAKVISLLWLLQVLLSAWQGISGAYPRC